MNTMTTMQPVDASELATIEGGEFVPQLPPLPTPVVFVPATPQPLTPVGFCGP